MPGRGTTPRLAFFRLTAFLMVAVCCTSVVGAGVCCGGKLVGGRNCAGCTQVRIMSSYQAVLIITA